MESTHASRHPLQPVITPVSHPLGKDGEARRKINRAKREVLQGDYDAFNARRLQEMQELAMKHNIELTAIQADLSLHSNLSKRRKPTLQNALTSLEAERLNAGKLDILLRPAAQVR